MVTVPDLTGAGLETLPGRVGHYLDYSLSPAIKEGEMVELVVTDQYPKPGTKVMKNSTITVYYELSELEDETVEDD